MTSHLSNKSFILEFDSIQFAKISVDLDLESGMILGSSGGIGFEWYLKYVRKTGLACFCVGPNGKRGSRNVHIVRTPLRTLLQCSAHR